MHCKITRKWVVKEKEPESTAVYMANRNNTPRRPLTRSMASAQGLTSNPGKDLSRVESNWSQSTKSNSGPQIQNTRSSSTPHTISSLYPRLFVVFMSVDDNDDEEQSNDQENS